MSLLITGLGWLLIGLALIGSACCLLATVLLRQVLAQAPPAVGRYPPVTMLKPLHGSEPGLGGNLASFCVQDYPAPVQIVFGLADRTDGVGAVVRDLLTRHPRVDAELLVDPCTHGANRKVANLINMVWRVKYPVLVVSDSDIRVTPSYLRAVVAALEQPGVGAVTCLYRGVPRGGFWARFAAMGVSYQFLPNAVVGIAMGLATPCFGATIVLKREMLAAIGGFEAFSDTLADDYEIGHAVRRHGLRVAVSSVVVDHLCTEKTAGAMLARELRWGRTIRTIDRPGYVGSALTHPVPLALTGAILLAFAAPAVAVLIAALATRAILKGRIDARLGVATGSGWLLPLRDCASFGIFLASLWGKSVDWRGARLQVGAGGLLSRL